MDCSAAFTVSDDLARPSFGRRSFGEEPISARLRRRRQAPPASEPAITPELPQSLKDTSLAADFPTVVIPEPITFPATPSHNTGTIPEVSIKPGQHFHDYVASRRQRKFEQPKLF
jgi:hypothetical protein